MKELQEAIVTTFSTSQLYTDGVRLYFARAPESVTYPYIVFHLITDVMESTFSSEFEDFTVQFSCFSDKNSSTEVNNLFTGIKTIYDDCKVSVSGYDLISFVRDLSFIDTDIENSDWSYVIQYKVLIEKN